MAADRSAPPRRPSAQGARILTRVAFLRRRRFPLASPRSSSTPTSASLVSGGVLSLSHFPWGQHALSLRYCLRAFSPRSGGTRAPPASSAPLALPSHRHCLCPERSRQDVSIPSPCSTPPNGDLTEAAGKVGLGVTAPLRRERLGAVVGFLAVWRRRRRHFPRGTRRAYAIGHPR